VEEDEGIVLAHFAGRAKWNRARNHAGGEQEEVEKGRGGGGDKDPFGFAETALRFKRKAVRSSRVAV